MSLFRSEEHVERWLAREGRQRGAIVPLVQIWALSRVWYADPRRRDWRPRTREESQAVLASVGLTGEFWRMG